MQPAPCNSNLVTRVITYTRPIELTPQVLTNQNQIMQSQPALHAAAAMRCT